MTLKENAYTFAEETDFHGCNRVLNKEAGLIRRILWAILLVGGIGGVCYQVADRLIYYLEYHHITKVDLLYSHVLEFPAVTVCNLNKYKLNSLTERDIVNVGRFIGLVSSNFSLEHADHYPSAYVTAHDAKDWVTLNSTLYDPDFNLTEFSYRTGHQRDMILYCSFHGVECPSDAFQASLTHLGLCYTYNYGSEPLLLYKSGNGNGLKLFLNAEEEEYIESEDTEDLGFKVSLHHQSEPPFVKELGFGITPSNHYLVAVQQKQLILLPQPYGSCAPKSTPLKYYDEYSVPACRLECETDTIFQNCSCKLPESPGDLRVCNAEEDEACAVPSLRHIEETDACLCSNPCEAMQYSSTLSSLKLRSETISILRSRTTAGTIDAALTESHIAAVNVYFEILGYELIEQLPAYDFVAFLSDLGGNLGLYLGASVLAMFHIIDWGVKSCCEKKRQDSPNKVDTIHVDGDTQLEKVNGVA